MENNADIPRRLLLHACCGPCSLEPVRLLRERCIEPTIHYVNPNIAPEDEYFRRLGTIRDWCASEGIELIEAPYDPEVWERTAGKAGKDSSSDPKRRMARCRTCYRVRFEDSAAYAKEHGFDALGTTLSVSPYQYTQIIAEELQRAAEKSGIDCFFEDYSPYYGEAARRSREAGMYRQNYCGCLFSKDEAEEERRERAEARHIQKAEREKARAMREKDLETRRAQKAEYDSKQARKRAILKAMREERRHRDEASQPSTPEEMQAQPSSAQDAMQEDAR